MKKLKLYLLLSLLTLSIGQMRAEDAPLTTIQAIFDEATATGTTEKAVIITFDNWVVSGATTYYAYVTDGTKGFFFMPNNLGFAAGDKLTGTSSVNLKLSYGSAAITKVTGGTLAKSTGGVITPVEVNIDDLSGVNTGAPIIVKNVTYDGSDLVDASSDTITPFNTLYSGMSFTDGKTYDVKGIYLQYSGFKRIMPRRASDIVKLPVVKWSIGEATEELGVMTRMDDTPTYEWSVAEKSILNAGTYTVKVFKNSDTEPAATRDLTLTQNGTYWLRFTYKPSAEEVLVLESNREGDVNTSVDNSDAAVNAEKFFHNGQLIIRKNGVEYNAQGARIY